MKYQSQTPKTKTTITQIYLSVIFFLLKIQKDSDDLFLDGENDAMEQEFIEKQPQIHNYGSDNFKIKKKANSALNDDTQSQMFEENLLNSEISVNTQSNNCNIDSKDYNKTQGNLDTYAQPNQETSSQQPTLNSISQQDSVQQPKPKKPKNKKKKKNSGVSECTLPPISQTGSNPSKPNCQGKIHDVDRKTKKKHLGKERQTEWKFPFALSMPFQTEIDKTQEKIITWLYFLDLQEIQIALLCPNDMGNLFNSFYIYEKKIDEVSGEKNYSKKMIKCIRKGKLTLSMKEITFYHKFHTSQMAE